MFVPPNEQEGDLPAQIAETIAARVKPTDQLVCQLALGSHVDHVLVRQAVELLERPVLYDVDIPYLFNHPDELGQKTAKLQPQTHRITDLGVGAWETRFLPMNCKLAAFLPAQRICAQKFVNTGLNLWEYGYGLLPARFLQYFCYL